MNCTLFLVKISSHLLCNSYRITDNLLKVGDIVILLDDRQCDSHPKILSKFGIGYFCYWHLQKIYE